MAKHTKVLTVLSTAAVTGLITAAVGSTAFAKTSAILVQNGSNDYRYDYTSLASAFEDYSANPSNGALYQDYITRLAGKSPAALYDDVQKAYIDYSKVASAFEDAQAVGKTFNLNAYTESSKDVTTPAAPISDVTVGSDGKIAVTPVNNDLTVLSVSAINSTQAQVTFNAPVKASSVVPNDFKVTDANGNQLFISKAEVSSTDSKSVILTFFDKFADKAAYTVATSNVQDANSKVMKATTNSFAYAKAAVTKVEFTGTTLPASTTDLTKYVKITDALGRDVTTENSVSFTSDDSNVGSNGAVSGAVDGEVAVVKVSVNGTTVTANAVITFKTQLANTLVGYTIGKTADLPTDATAFSKLTSDKVTHYVAKSDTAEYLGLYYNDQYGNAQNVVVSGATVTNLTPSTVIVDASGHINPIATGTGYVKVKYGNVEQTIEIDVRDDASVASLSVDSANVTAVLGTNIPTTVKLTFKDQYGTAIDASKIDFSKLTTTVNAGDENMLAVAKNTDGTLSLIPLKQGNTSFKIEYKDATTNVDLVQNVQVSITNAGAVAGYKVEADATKLDVNADNTADTTDATKANVKVYAIDANGNKIQDVTSSANLSFVTTDTVSSKLVKLSGQEVDIDGDADSTVSYKPQNATVVVSVGTLQVGTLTFTVDNTTATPAAAIFTNNAIYGAQNTTIDTLLQGVVTVNDQFGSGIGSFNKANLTFSYQVTNVNAISIDSKNTITGVSILNNAGTADVVVTGVYYNGAKTNLLAAPQVIKLSVKQQLPIVTNLTFNGVSITPAADGTIDLSQFAGKDIVSSTGSLSADSKVTVVAKDGTTVLYPSTDVKTTDNFFTFVKDGNIKASTLAALDGAKVTVTAGSYNTVYTLKTIK